MFDWNRGRTGYPQNCNESVKPLLDYKFKEPRRCRLTTKLNQRKGSVSNKLGIVVIGEL